MRSAGTTVVPAEQMVGKKQNGAWQSTFRRNVLWVNKEPYSIFLSPVESFFATQIIRSIQNRIYELRGARVMLDFDLATLYKVETRVLNQTVRRNIEQLPEDFMFQLTKAEYENIQFQINSINESKSSQIVTTSPSSQFVMISFLVEQKNKPNGLSFIAMSIIICVVPTKK